jgi:hypothetical protein
MNDGASCVPVRPSLQTGQYTRVEAGGISSDGMLGVDVIHEVRLPILFRQ